MILIQLVKNTFLTQFLENNWYINDKKMQPII